jgi:DeoD family purine-nucleoside phosphorylase
MPAAIDGKLREMSREEQQEQILLETLWNAANTMHTDKDSAERSSCRATRCLPGEIAPYVLLPGDPGRARLIAEAFFDDGRLVVMNREFHSYTGNYKGLPVSVISTGLGSPGAAMVLQDLPRLGVRGAIRVGTCGALDPNLLTGDIIVSTGAVRDEGASKKHMPEIYPAVPDFELTAALLAASQAVTDRVSHGLVLTSDGFRYPGLADEYALYAGAGVLGIEMECSAVMVLGKVCRVPTACVMSIDGYAENVASGNLKPDSGARDEGLGNAITAALEAFISFEAKQHG